MGKACVKKKCKLKVNDCYRGSALQKRLRDREKEMEADERDRKREKEELEEIRQRLLAEGHPDPDAELQRVGIYFFEEKLIYILVMVDLY